MGDGTDLPIRRAVRPRTSRRRSSPAGSRRWCGGRAPKTNYGGRVMCFLETGNRKATALRFDYEHPPTPPKPSIGLARGEVDVQQAVLGDGARRVGSPRHRRRRKGGNR